MHSLKVGQFLMQLDQSTVGKKMAAVHFTTIPGEPNTAYKTQGKQIFTIFVPVLRKLCIVGLKIL